MRMGLQSLAILVALTFISLIQAQGVEPPYITKPNGPQKFYKETDKEVNIECHARGSPTPTYAWRRNGDVIKSDDEYMKTDPETGTLTIPVFTSREEGVFVCLASNLVGEETAVSFSHPQEILARRVKPFTNLDVETTEKVREYDYAHLPCSNKGEIVADLDLISYKWYIKEGTDQMKPGERLFVDSEGTLHFTYALESDELVNKFYHCSVSHADTSQILLGPAMVLEVQKNDNPVAISPLNVYYTKGLKVLLATTATLECVFSGYDPRRPDKMPKIEWFDGAGRLIVPSDKYELENKNRKLTVKNVKETDDQEFTCKGTNSAGDIPQAVLLNVTSAPLWKNPPKSQTVIQGKDVQIMCDAKSLDGEVDPSRPTWYINGREFPEVNKPNAVLSDDKKSMTVRSVTKAKDIICVQCIVKNSEGQTLGDACINVIMPIVLTLTCNKCGGASNEDCSCLRWELSKDDSLEFQLSVKTDVSYTNKLTNQWAFEEKKYNLPSLPPHWKRDPTTQLYYVNTSDLTDEEFMDLAGQYSYKVYHSFDSANLEFNIEVKGVTPAPIVSSAGMDMWLIGLVIGLVFLLIIIILIIFVLCRKQQEGVYNLGKKETGAGLDPAKELKDKAFHDLSRPDYDDYEYPDKKPKGELEYDDVPMEGDDESLGEYGDEEDIHFNEDGSFIGNYSVKPTNNNRSTESTI